MKASHLQCAVEERMPRCRDEAGDEVPFPVEVLEVFESPSRRGYGPQGRGLSPTDTLLFASLAQLYRDAELGQRIRALAASWPACVGLRPGVPARFMVDHVTIGGHDVGPCREWLSRVVGLARDAGCPSLHAMLSQFELAAVGVTPGAVAMTRLRAVAAPGPRRPAGVRDRPAMGLLARRAHAVGGLAALRARIAQARREKGLAPIDDRARRRPVARRGWPGLALELDREIGEREAGGRPDRRDVAYPAWREWWRNEERRAGGARDRVELENSVRLASEDLGQAYRRGAARIRQMLDANLPDIG